MFFDDLKGNAPENAEITPEMFMLYSHWDDAGAVGADGGVAKAYLRRSVPSDERIDELLDDPHTDKLRSLRNAVFHVQDEPFNPKLWEFLLIRRLNCGDFHLYKSRHRTTHLPVSRALVLFLAISHIRRVSLNRVSQVRIIPGAPLVEAG